VAQGASLSVANDAALTTLGFGDPSLGFPTFVDFNGGVLRATGNLIVARTISLLTLGGIIDTNGFDSIFSGVIINSGSLTKMGTGTLTLSGNNTFSGGTNIAAGVLSVSTDSNLGTGDINISNNAELLNTGSLTSSKAITLGNGGGTIASATNTIAEFSGLIDGSGPLRIGDGTNTGKIILTADNTYSGGTSIAVGSTLQLGSGGISGSVLGDIVDNGILIVAHSNPLAIAGEISGTGNLIQNGTGTLILSGNSSYNGTTIVSTGILRAGSTTGFSPSSAFTVNSVLDLNGFSNSVGSLAGTGSVTNTGGTTATLTAGADNTSTTFSGVLQDGSTASLGLTKVGTGTLTLSGGNTYTGGTTISGGILQIGNGGTTGSIVGTVLDNGSLVFNRSDAVTLPGIVSGSGSLVQNGSGSLTLTAPNAYAGGTVINQGTLIVENAHALGTGNVTVNGGILEADPQPINVLGIYTQNAGGTLQLNIAGRAAGQFDVLNVGGNAFLNGTLRLINQGYQPASGDKLRLISTGGAISGRFSTFVNPFTLSTGFKTIDLVYARQSVTLEFLNVPPPVPPVPPTPPAPPIIITTDFSSFAITPNQLAAAKLLDAVQLDPRATNLISFLNAEPFANLPNDFQKISPEGLTAFYEISFSNANIQKLNLEGRMDEIHSGSNGFSSNMKVSGATVNLEERTDADGKSAKAVAEPILQHVPENHWGVWVTGFGDFVNVDGDGNARGYNFTTGGVSLGIDYRITDQLAVGAMGEYSHTWTSLKPGGHMDVDSGRGGVYATWFSHGIYVNGAIYGGHNNYDSGRSSLGGVANGSTEGAEWSTFLGGGYDFHLGPLTLGPIASLQYTDVGIDDFSEKGSLAALAIHSGSAESLRSDLGFRVFYQWQLGKIILEPSFKIAWEHEYKYSALPITAGFAGIPGPSSTFFGPSEGHDSAVVNAGVSVQVTRAISTYLNYDGQLGRGNYDSNAVTGGVRISF
jgi:fibronectin-binding autotransporter adhesin